nr:uncharacterized protein LOC123765223 [Procambarus clarkii]
MVSPSNTPGTDVRGSQVRCAIYKGAGIMDVHSHSTMTSGRSSVVRALLLVTLVLSLFADGSAVQVFSLSQQARYLRHRDKVHFINSIVKHLFKRTQPYRSTDMETSIRENYVYVPKTIIDTSTTLHQGVNCSAFRVTHHVNTFTEELHRSPTWLHSSSMIGDCPTRYVKKNMNEPIQYFPEILEAQCICEDSQCSQDGYRCEPLKYNMLVWKFDSFSNRSFSEYEYLTVACVCARRPSSIAGSSETLGEPS